MDCFVNFHVSFGEGIEQLLLLPRRFSMQAAILGKIFRLSQADLWGEGLGLWVWVLALGRTQVLRKEKGGHSTKVNTLKPQS